jgi:hypothetical protein
MRADVSEETAAPIIRMKRNSSMFLFTVMM